MKKWFRELQKGDVIKRPKLKKKGDRTYFDNEDFDYFKIIDIVKGDIITINLTTNHPMTLMCGLGIDDWLKYPSFEIEEIDNE